LLCCETPYISQQSKHLQTIQSNSPPNHPNRTQFTSPPNMSGAEQDRYDGKFGLDRSTITSAKQKIQDATSSLKSTSGSEVDRYSNYFSGLGADGLKRLAATKGVGAEQDRYASHFSLGSSVADKAADALTNDHLLQNAWLGHDGKQRLLHLASKKGVGAEQERYGRGMGVSEDTIRRGKEAVEGAWERVTK